MTLNRSPLRIDTCLELMLGVNQQIVAINARSQLDAEVSCPNTTYSLPVVHVKEDDMQRNESATMSCLSYEYKKQQKRVQGTGSLSVEC